jgi:hypothetical protein
MLAVKLHKHKRPYLGKGSYLIPILDWGKNKLFINDWIRILRTMRSGNNKINYITLVKIPDDHPVFLAEDWIKKLFWGIEFKPLREIERETKENIKDTPCWADPPELILGKPLPKSCIKWTKDIRLLYGMSKNKRQAVLG